MSAITESLSTLDIRSTRRVPLSRLVRVELRKMADTRAGMWLLIGVCAITVAAIVIVFAASDPRERTFMRFMTAVALPQQFLLPVLGILLITSEWTQRTALVNFTLEPVRRRIVTAKLIAAMLFGLGAVLIALAVATSATALGGSEVAWQSVEEGEVGKFGVLQASSILQGLAFGLLILNSAAAISTFFILPTAFSIVSTFWKALADVAPWILLNRATEPLIAPGVMTAEEWTRLGVASLIWIVLPMVVGLFQVLRKEVK